MSFKDFSQIQYIRTMDTAEIIRLGGFKLVSSMELAYIRALVNIYGTMAGSEKLRINVYADSAHTKKIFHSDYSTLSGKVLNESGNAVTGNWIGMLRFDFSRQNLNKNIWYYLSMETLNYTANISLSTDTYFIGIAHDYPNPRYASANVNYYADTNLAFEIFGYQ